MQDHPECALSYHDAEVLDTNTASLSYLWSRRYGKRKGNVKTVIRYATYMTGSSVMVRREYLLSNGADERILRAPDWYLWICVLANSKGDVGYIDKVLTRYQLHSDSVTATSGWKHEERLLTLLLIEFKFPQYAHVVNIRRAEIYFMWSIDLFKQKEIGIGLSLFIRSVFMAFPFIAPWLRLIWRELLYTIHSRK